MKRLLLIPLAIAAFVAPLAQAYDGWWGGRGSAPYYTPHYVPHGHMIRSLPDGFIRLFIGGLEYYYWEGMYYRMTTGGYLVVPAPVGAVVTSIPPGYQHVVVDGVPYYIINGVTYMQTAYGYYQVVPTPPVISNMAPVPSAAYAPETSSPPPQPTMAPAPNPAANVSMPVERPAQDAAASNAGDTFTVNIPNAKGGYVPVTLKRSGNGFIGPQGEFYTEFPRVDQLKLMYGK